MCHGRAAAPDAARGAGPGWHRERGVGPGYELAGKTGTASKADPETGKYSETVCGVAGR
jgi:cell division protein FtsI/penicillin-binding protein 2